MYWQCRDHRLDCGEVPLIMGILNVTPDSFSDGGQFADHAAAIAQAKQMLIDGADIIDIGGESTRPGAGRVDADEELRRVLPVIRALATETDAIISIDTSKATVARAALEAGAQIVNDVSAMSADPAMAATVAEFGAGVVLMHMQGTPREMQDNPQYDNVVSEICNYLQERVSLAVAAGIAAEQIAIDPGIGFGKSTEHNLQILANLQQLTKIGQPLLVGLSRKRFIGILTESTVENRLSGSLAGLTCAVLNGAGIMRVHDVGPSWQAGRIAAAIRSETNEYALREKA